MTAPLAPRDDAPDRASLALWTALALLLAARLAAPFAGSMTFWALGLPRFLSPVAAWLPLLLAAAALLPALSRRAAPPLATLGDRLASGSALPTIAAALAPALLVAVLPDRTWFVGDFLLRQNTLGGPASSLPYWYPYCLPLDLLVHDSIGRAVMARFGWGANDYSRVLGAIEAGLLGALAARFTRALGVRGVAALVAWATLALGGAITIFAGYGKAFTEMTVLVAAAGTFGLEAVQGRRSLLAMALVVALALGVHRSALGLVPAIAVAALLVPGGPFARARRDANLVALVIVIAALAILLPKIAGIVRATDTMHFAPDDVRRLGILAATFAPARLIDLFDLLVLLGPLAIPAAVIAASERRLPGPGREIAFLAGFALPLVLVVPFVHPSQGLMRDWDDFAAAGLALALPTAWWQARWLGARPRRAALAVAALLALAAPGFQWLVHQNDRARGLARVEALLEGPPRRADHERASGWEFLGLRSLDLGDLDRAARAFDESAAIEPSPHALRALARVEGLRGNFPRARQVQRTAIARMTRQPGAWLELAEFDVQLGDTSEARRAAQVAMKQDPGLTAAAQALIARIEAGRVAPSATRR